MFEWYLEFIWQNQSVMFIQEPTLIFYNFLEKKKDNNGLRRK
jgi:hypothetical protein